MNRSRVAAILLMLAVGILGAFSVTARAETAYYYDDDNHLSSIVFDDQSWMEYVYDANGNLTQKIYHGTTSYQPPITATWTGGGTISPASANVTLGGSQTFSITPNPGCIILQVLVDGDVPTPPLPATYTFTNVQCAHTIQATFSSMYSITTSVSGSGSISPASASVGWGASQTFLIAAAPGFFTADVQVDGVSQGPDGAYTFTNVSANHVLSATFIQTSPVRIVRTGTTYQGLQAAYNAAASGDTIQVQNVELSENFTANLNVAVTIDGGYNGDFSAYAGTTTLYGAPVISSGTVTWQNFIIQ